MFGLYRWKQHKASALLFTALISPVGRERRGVKNELGMLKNSEGVKTVITLIAAYFILAVAWS